MVRRDHAAGRAPGTGRRVSTRPARVSGFGASGDLAAQRARLREVIGPVVEAAGYDLEELSVSRAGRRHVLRITVVALVAYAFGQVPAVIVHDYGSVIATIAFLMAFWAFAYNTVLERREVAA